MRIQPNYLANATRLSNTDEASKAQGLGDIGSAINSVFAPRSIQQLNEDIWNLEQNGESRPGQIDALRAQRDAAIERYTGANDASLYSANIVAEAQSSNISYNAAVDARNFLIMMGNASAPTDKQRDLYERVENLPWERPQVNARVDELTSESLSFDAAVVVAMTERRSQFSWGGGPFGLPGFEQPSMQGDWLAGFADRAARSGAELAAWADSLADGSATGTVSLSAGDDAVTVTQRADGQIVVSYDDGSVPDQVLDPATLDRIVILGGNGNDTIRIDSSVTESLVVAGGNGRDKIFGGGGNDVLIGGDGNDLIRGASGSDIIIGGAGDDDIEGGNGGDVMVGGLGNDYLSGGGGNDVALGGAGRDSIYGGYGQDVLLGQSGDDNLNGGSADDYISGGTGRDAVVGGKGNDQLVGGGGQDRFIGASGADTYVDLGAGDHAILERSELRENALSGASTEVVEIDSTLGDVDELLADGNREEFRTRVADDLELLRSTRSGQQMLNGLADNTARTGAVTRITELDATQDTVVINGTTSPTENGFATFNSDGVISGYNATPSAGSDSTIYYNPGVNILLNETSGPGAIPPVVVLFHEMSHAFNATSGTLLTTINQVPGNPDNGILNAEMQAVGLPIGVDHDNDPTTPQVEMPNFVDQATENDLRRELGMDPRVSYR